MKKLFLVLALVLVVASLGMAEVKFSGSVIPYVYMPSLDVEQVYFELTPTFNLALDKTFSLIVAGDSTFDVHSLSMFNDGITAFLKSGYLYGGGKADFGFIDVYAHLGLYYDGQFYWDFLTNFKAIPNATITVEYIGADAVGAKGTLEGWVTFSF